MSDLKSGLEWVKVITETAISATIPPADLTLGNSENVTGLN